MVTPVMLDNLHDRLACCSCRVRIAQASSKSGGAMRKKTHKRQRKSLPESLLKTSRKGEIELTEQELGKVSGGVKIGDVKGETIDDKHKDWIEVL
jgi:hypothetical protein